MAVLTEEGTKAGKKDFGSGDQRRGESVKRVNERPGCFKTRKKNPMKRPRGGWLQKERIPDKARITSKRECGDD
jgi:hypothetical protein